MPKELIRRTVGTVRLAAVVGVAVAAGAAVGVAALDPGASVVHTVSAGASSSGSDHVQRSHGVGSAKDRSVKSTTADKGEAAKKDKAAEGTGRSGAHGRCVSAVARDKDAVGGPHDNHGWAVSRAAHRCPHPAAAPSAGS